MGGLFEKIEPTAVRFSQKLHNGEYADRLASLATRALLYEVMVTPKPGLVDRNNNGAHKDMDPFTFVDSAVALTPYFRDMAGFGLAFGGDVGAMLPHLRMPGILAEECMLAATGGVNTHKGLVFSMGLFCAAAGFLYGRNELLSVESLLGACASIAVEAPNELAESRKGSGTHGRRAYARFGLTGIRGEAAAGYPNIRRHGLPVFRHMLEQGHSCNDAGVAALLHLMAHVEDTNIVSRSNAATLIDIHAEIGAFLEASPDMPAMLHFAACLDNRFISGNISPGGSADLLALIYFLHMLLP